MFKLENLVLEKQNTFLSPEYPVFSDTRQAYARQLKFTTNEYVFPYQALSIQDIVRR